MQHSKLHLKLLVRESRTTLPRCLQIWSRRGFILKGLMTQPLEQGKAHLHVTLYGPEQWHNSISSLLSKNFDVLAVEEVSDDE